LFEGGFDRPENLNELISFSKGPSKGVPRGRLGFCLGSPVPDASVRGEKDNFTRRKGGRECHLSDLMQNRKLYRLGKEKKVQGEMNSTTLRRRHGILGGLGGGVRLKREGPITWGGGRGGWCQGNAGGVWSRTKSGGYLQLRKKG